MGMKGCEKGVKKMLTPVYQLTIIDFPLRVENEGLCICSFDNKNPLLFLKP